MNPKNKESKMNQSNHINEDFVNGSATIFSKKIRKYTELMTHPSDQSTLNTFSNLSTENNCNGNIENIGEKINNVFEALEKIIVNNETESIEEDTLNTNSSSASHEEDKTNLKSKKKSQTIAIPKLDFSDIFDFYQNTPVYIKKIKIRKNKDKNNEKNDDKHKKHHHHHKSSHSIKKN